MANYDELPTPDKSGEPVFQKSQDRPADRGRLHSVILRGVTEGYAALQSLAQLKDRETMSAIVHGRVQEEVSDMLESRDLLLAEAARLLSFVPGAAGESGAIWNKKATEWRSAYEEMR